MPPSGVSLGDVAAKAGVSKATASRAIRGLPGVAPEKARAVADAMRALDYQPDPLLAAFSRYRWPTGARASQATIAHIVDRWTAANRPVLDAVTARCHALGYRYAGIELSSAERATAIDQRLAQIGALGVIIDLHDDRSRVEFDWSRSSCVVMGESLPKLAAPRIGTDWARMIRDAAARLRALGHTRIGFIIRRFAGSDLTQELHDAALAARHATREAQQVPLLVLPGTARTATPLAAAWWREHRPSAVIADWPEIATGLVQGGATIPTDCSFVTLIRAGLDAAGLPASGYSQEEVPRANLAIDLLHARILHGERGLCALPPRLLQPGLWVEGRTLRAWTKRPSR